jgi:predicted nucleic acid-binding protein
MPAVSKIYLDTNVFIMAFEWRDKTSDLLSQLFAGQDRPPEPRFVTSELTLAELLVLPFHRNDQSLIDTYESLISTNYWLDVAPVQIPILRYAAVLRSQHKSLKLPDAIHLSTAIGTSCSHILTADLGIKGEYDLSHPHQRITAEAASLTVLRPDEITLTSLLKSMAE